MLLVLEEADRAADEAHGANARETRARHPGLQFQLESIL